MSNLVLATPDLSDDGTLTASAETAAGPVTNLQKMQPTDLWVVASTTPYLVLDLGAVTSFNLVAALFLNAVLTDTWRIRTADTEAGLTAAPDEDTTATAMTDISSEGHVFHWIPAGWTNRWIRIDFVVSSPFMAGRLYVANGFQPSLNYQPGGPDGYDDDSIIDITDGGNLIPNFGTNRAVFGFTLNLSDETERHTIREINRTRGSSSDVIVIRDPVPAANKSDVLYIGLLQRRREAITNNFNRHKISYQLISL